MFSTLNLLILILWIFSAISDYSYFVYFAQLKEYRWDRFRDFLNTEQGKHFTFQFNIVHRALLIMIALFLPLSIPLQKAVILFILVINFIHDIYKIFKRKKFIRPVFTFKSSFLILIPIFLEVSFLFKSHNWDALLILMMTRIFVLGLIVYFVNFLTDLIKKIIIKRATRKITTYKNLKVIGITGSYGKTTTKIFLEHFLTKKFKVISTPKHVNTEIGIAKFILNTDFSDQQIFIVEMGAYNLGEIKTICDMVKPTIGILTAIANQHLSLFGSMKNLQRAKYELLRSLPQDGLAVTNSDNPYCREFLSELKCQIKTFGTEVEFKPNLLIQNIHDSLDTVEATVTYEKNEPVTTKAHLRGVHNVFNIVPCVLVSYFFGLQREDVLNSIKELPQTVNLYKYGNCNVIDDSYNSNPEGFKSALDYLSKFPTEQKRIVITRGMLELGEKSNGEHEKIAGEISYTADELVLITPDFIEPIKNGLVPKFNIELKTIYEPLELLNYVKTIKNSHSAILLENRLPKIVLDEILQNSEKEI
ncbi:MAG: UDP-N-acetylmuramoyl-tripeptide--D-alanyl-D-alanine ligase [Candidatus Magasanikiibacteriota bacterium]